MDYLNYIRSKVFVEAGKHLDWQLAVWRFHDRRIVFTNGCFDILHLGHIDYLARAAAEGNLMIVGLNTDASVKKIKGGSRPVMDEQSRSMALAALGFVDAVILFDAETPYELIRRVQPDVLVKGKDYKPEDIVGGDIVEKKGGKIVTIDLVEGYATTAIIDKIKNS
jgi:rfaE bifunctional protein nucleotidyltransferase chain/domain